ncbi:amidohydrolase family protein [uncultured Microbacterium sp.]|uniref:amidohydrolase n=1 Tax=uncultured Microbacterium sp. TaxID=191216 RepID=UPI0025DAA84E|nr:amidohydrolase family protein [uncultured Microbacterium sp.]
MSALEIGDSPAVIRGVRVAGRGRELLFDDEPVDVFLRAGAIADIAPAGALAASGPVLDGTGLHLVPGLWDHHVHVVQWALVAQRAALGDAETATQAAAIMRDAPTQSDGRRVGTGFRDAFWPEPPTRALLDAATGEVPTYLINADVHSVWLNSAAFRLEGFEPTLDGLLREEPAFEISRRLNLVDPAAGDEYVERMARAAAARGIVGLRDFDMAWNADAWARRVGRGFDALRVEFGIYPGDLDRAIAEELRTGEPVAGGGELVRVGPLKAITDGSLGTRTAACSHDYAGDAGNRGVLTIAPDELLDLMTRATAAGVESAIHAIGDVANARALDAFAYTGAAGRIEHAQLVASADIVRFAKLGVGASVQPEHAIDDRDLADTIWSSQTATPYPLRALADAGVGLFFGSDAPVSPLDPWAAIAAATSRTRDGREPWRPEQAIEIAVAMDASTHGGTARPAEIAPGAPADLALCVADPLAADGDGLRAMTVAATLIGGRLTHLS